jgi:hypothetical protein
MPTTLALAVLTPAVLVLTVVLLALLALLVAGVTRRARADARTRAAEHLPEVPVFNPYHPWDRPLHGGTTAPHTPPHPPPDTPPERAPGRRPTGEATR